MSSAQTDILVAIEARVNAVISTYIVTLGILAATRTSKALHSED